VCVFALFVLSVFCVLVLRAWFVCVFPVCFVHVLRVCVFVNSSRESPRYIFTVIIFFNFKVLGS